MLLFIEYKFNFLSFYITEHHKIQTLDFSKLFQGQKPVEYHFS